jgi:hypothetical protein
MPGRRSLPDTLKRSPEKAQRTWIKAHDSAIEEYGEGERAHRTAFAALKHSFRKKGDHWVARDERGSTKDELYERAKKLDVAGRSKMSKKELARAIARKQ